VHTSIHMHTYIRAYHLLKHSTNYTCRTCIYKNTHSRTQNMHLTRRRGQQDGESGLDGALFFEHEDIRSRMDASGKLILSLSSLPPEASHDVRPPRHPCPKPRQLSCFSTGLCAWVAKICFVVHVCMHVHIRRYMRTSRSSD
jgi:hypothetical protein